MRNKLSRVHSPRKSEGCEEIAQNHPSATSVFTLANFRGHVWFPVGLSLCRVPESLTLRFWVWNTDKLVEQTFADVTTNKPQSRHVCFERLDEVWNFFRHLMTTTANDMTRSWMAVVKMMTVFTPFSQWEFSVAGGRGLNFETSSRSWVNIR